jgi:hypothetical protein
MAMRINGKSAIQDSGAFGHCDQTQPLFAKLGVWIKANPVILDLKPDTTAGVYQ